MAMGTGYSKAAKKHKKVADAIRKLEAGANPQMEGAAKKPRKIKVPKKAKMATSYGAASKMEGVATPKPPKLDVQPTKLAAATRRLDEQAAARAGNKGKNRMAKRKVATKTKTPAPKPKAPGAQVRVTRTTPRGSFSAAQRVAGKAQETGQAQVTSVRSSGMGRIRAASQATAPPRVHSVSGGKYATHGTVMDVAGPGKGSFITEKPKTPEVSRKYAERQVARGQQQDAISAQKHQRAARGAGTRTKLGIPETKPAAAPAAKPAVTHAREPMGTRLARRVPKAVQRMQPPPHLASMEGASSHLRSAARATSRVGKIAKPLYRGAMRVASKGPLVALGAQLGGIAGARTGESGTGTAIGAATGGVAQGTLALGGLVPGLRTAAKVAKIGASRAAVPLAVAETGYQVGKLGVAMHGARKAQKGQAVHGEGLKKKGFAVKKVGFWQGAATAFSDTGTSNVSIIQRSPEKTAAATKQERSSARADMTPGAKKTLGKLKAARKKKKDSRPKPF